MAENFDLAEYMGKGIEHIISNVLKSSVTNMKETSFVIKFMSQSKKARKIRDELEEKGEHIPPFLMCSIETNCNLFCKGCYARANKSCGEHLKISELSVERWAELFNEAKNIGVSFALLLGGEPLMRREVIEKAAEVREIVFPIFTNGTLINDSYIELFDRNRNLVPMISIEGNREQTDNRRGIGTYNDIMRAMNKLNEKKILFGSSITVTTKNLLTVTSKDFIRDLVDKGVKAVTFVEYVPINESTINLAPSDKEREILKDSISELRKEFDEIVFLSFPGDEKYSGGCMSAGRGFFHINANGNAEPCPLSPYSDVNLKNINIREALKSPLFKKLKDSGVLMENHIGGCVLFEKRDKVQKLKNGEVS